LSVYLTLPEVDNDVRSEKTKAGLRGANKEGRWTASPPKGYKFLRDGSDKPILVPTEEAPHIIWAFKQVSKGIKNVMEVRALLKEKKQINIPKNTFYHILRNPCYMGFIIVKQYKDEPEQIIRAIHEPIISEELFYQVQDIMNERKRIANCGKKQKVMRPELPLRGILKCSNCSALVTGSGSRSKTGVRHWYYHCNDCRKVRFRADDANAKIEQFLSTIELTEDAHNLCEKILLNEYSSEFKVSGTSKRESEIRLKKLETRLTNLKNSFMDGEVKASDYGELKSFVTEELNKLKKDIQRYKGQGKRIEDYLKRAIAIIPNIAEWYLNSGVQEKQFLLSSIFPENLTYEKNKSRTPILNPILAMILSYDKGYRGKENGLNSNKTVQPDLG
jgi:hypothetical protein